MLVLPVIEELIMAVADMNNVKFIPSADAIARATTISPREARKAVEAMRKSKTESATVQEEKPRGLMAKPTEMME
jgi:ribosomal protein L22